MKACSLITVFMVMLYAYPGHAGETGICSWYGADGEIPPGHPTASGEGFNRFAMKAAHKTLPFGTCIRVRKISKSGKPSRKRVYASINDRGPFSPGRIVDLTYAAFGKLAKHDVGLIKCSYKIVNKRRCS